MKKIAALVLALGMLLTACASEQPNSTPADRGSVVTDTVAQETTVGIALPDEAVARWAEEGAALAEALRSAELAVELAYAQNDPWLQEDQVDKMIAMPVDCLVIAAVDALALTDALARAKEAGIPVIAYDRLLLNTDAVTCHIAFDALAAGTAIAEYIVQTKQLETAQEEARTYTIELFMGSPEDNNGLLVHKGIMAVLQPYFDSGVLVCRSGRLAFEDTCVQNWSEEIAQKKCEKQLSGAYAGGRPDILCAASDSIAAGVCAALEEAGCTAEDWPLVTGRNADPAAVERIVGGKQSMTLYADIGVLKDQCVRTVQALLAGEQPEVNDTTSCYNGTVTVPAWLLPMQTVTGENHAEFLPADDSITEEPG